jgi:hypothetical protein
MSSDPHGMIRRKLQSRSVLKRRARSFFLFVALPAWLGPGLLDWWCHRRTHIEEPRNGGTKESLVHSAMFAEAGIPLLLAAALEMNPLLITLMTTAAAIHEATAMFDVRVAFESDRHVTQFEQHVHSFLEVMPFWIVPLMVLLHEPATKRWSLTRRSSALSKRDIALIAAGVALLGALPYSEELVRCLRGSRDANGAQSQPETDPAIVSTMTHPDLLKARHGGMA